MEFLMYLSKKHVHAPVNSKGFSVDLLLWWFWKVHSTSSYQLVIESYFTLVGRINARNHHSTMHLPRFGRCKCRHVRPRSNKCSSKDLSEFLRDLPKCNGVRNRWDINAMKNILGVWFVCFFCNHWAIQSDDISFHMRYTLDMRACLQ